KRDWSSDVCSSDLLRKIEGDKTELLGDVVEVSCRGWQSKVDTMSVVGSAVINQPIQQCLNRVRGVPARRQDDAGVQLSATEACQPGDSDWCWVLIAIHAAAGIR